MPAFDVDRAACDLLTWEAAMAKGRKVRSGEAAGLLQAWESSGEPMSSWCERRGLNWYSLSAYKGWEGRGEVAFAEIVEVAPPRAAEPERGSRYRLEVGGVGPPRAAEPDRGSRYRLEVGGVVIEVGDDFQSDTLQRLVRAVAAC